MAEEIGFEIPDFILENEIADYIARNHEDYLDALDQTANPDDNRSQVDEITVTEVHLYEDHVLIEYAVEYSAFHACRDMNYVESDDRVIKARRNGRTLIFDEFIYPPARSTEDEF